VRCTENKNKNKYIKIQTLHLSTGKVRCTENKNKNKYIKIQTLHLSTGKVRCTEKKIKKIHQNTNSTPQHRQSEVHRIN